MIKTLSSVDHFLISYQLFCLAEQCCFKVKSKLMLVSQGAKRFYSMLPVNTTGNLECLLSCTDHEVQWLSHGVKSKQGC